MIGLQLHPAVTGGWAVMVLCPMCLDLVEGEGVVLWDGKPPVTENAVKGFLIVCSPACADALRAAHPEVTIWGEKPIATFVSELAIATRTGDQVGRDMAHIARKRWDRTYHVETRGKRNGGTTE